MVKVAVHDGGGVIEGDVKRAIKKFRKDHHISKIQHREALANVGWTSEDWHAGAKETGETGMQQGRRGALVKLLHSTRHITSTSNHFMQKGHSQAVVSKIVVPTHALHESVAVDDMHSLKLKKLRSRRIIRL